MVFIHKKNKTAKKNKRKPSRTLKGKIKYGGRRREKVLSKKKWSNKAGRKGGQLVGGGWGEDIEYSS